MIFDSHCHIFSKNDLSHDYRTTSRLISMLHETRIPGRKSGSRDSERIVRFVDHILNYEAETLFLKMRETYGEDYAAVPLMMDGTYVTSLPGEDFERTSALNRITERVITPLSHTLGLTPEPQLAHGKKDLFSHNFTTQMNELRRLKKTYPDHIYPFLGIDPRRDEHDLKGVLMDLITERVGPGKTFSGVKLYTALGYSPTHPFFYSDDRKEPTMYAWCQKKGIPITIHFSPTGFAHINDTNPVRGDIYYPPAGRIVPAEDLYPEGVVTFEKKFWWSSFSDLVLERQTRLNHPLLWRKVLETYPRLKMNFAHMGGYSQVPLYMDNHPTGFWTEAALSYLQDYPNTYTDMSNFIFPGYDMDPLEGVKTQIYDKLTKSARRRVLYGSDFYMIYLMERGLSRYYDRFCNYFGSEMDKVARENPQAFLGL